MDSKKSGLIQAMLDALMRDKVRIGKPMRKMDRIGTLGSGSGRAKREAEMALAEAWEEDDED